MLLELCPLEALFLLEETLLRPQLQRHTRLSLLMTFTARYWPVGLCRASQPHFTKESRKDDKHIFSDKHFEEETNMYTNAA